MPSQYDLSEEEKIGLLMLMVEQMDPEWSERKKLERAMRYFGAATLTADKFDLPILSVLKIQARYVRGQKSPMREPEAKGSFEEAVFWDLINEYDLFDPMPQK